MQQLQGELRTHTTQKVLFVSKDISGNIKRQGNQNAWRVVIVFSQMRQLEEYVEKVGNRMVVITFLFRAAEQQLCRSWSEGKNLDGVGAGSLQPSQLWIIFSSYSYNITDQNNSYSTRNNYLLLDQILFKIKLKLCIDTDTNEYLEILFIYIKRCKNTMERI